MRRTYGMRAACAHCGQDIEWVGYWHDRGGNRRCVPFIRAGEIVKPRTVHTDRKGVHGETPRTDAMRGILSILLALALTACGGASEPPSEESCLADPRAECAEQWPGGYALCDDAGCIVIPWPANR